MSTQTTPTDTAITTLETRLLCACNLAYSIQPSGGFSPALNSTPFYAPIGYLAEPMAISGGTDNIDACLIGTNVDDGVIVAFRGTLAPAFTEASILDWLQDLLVLPLAFDGLPGKVHPGFYAAVESILADTLAEVQSQAAGGQNIYITGHSKGAPMATLFSYLLYNSGLVEQSQIQTVVTFASPNVGDGDFATAYNAVLSQSRYLNNLDIVPWLPPTPDVADEIETFENLTGFLKDIMDMDASWDYTAVGSGNYIAADYSVVAETAHPFAYPADLAADLGDIATAIGNGTSGLESIAAAHSIGCGSGYLNGVAGEGIDGNTIC